MNPASMPGAQQPYGAPSMQYAAPYGAHSAQGYPGAPPYNQGNPY